MIERFKNWLASIFSKYIMPDYEAHRRAAQAALSAELLAVHSRLSYMERRAYEAEVHVDMFKRLSDKVVCLAMNVPNEQKVPFVHEVVMEIENTRRYLK